MTEIHYPRSFEYKCEYCGVFYDYPEQGNKHFCKECIKLGCKWK